MADLVLSTRLIADAQGFRAEIKGSRQDLERLAGASGKTGRAARGAGRSLGRMGADARGAGARLRRLNDESRNLTAGLGGLRTMVAALGLGLLARSIVSANVEFQTLSASLRTVTGSAEAADAAFAALDEFAAKTPFQLEEVVGAFIKLKARGLDPSIAALRSYGNTASAMGRSLDQVIEAVADAATGEFERLREFGIQASAQGDEVAFTFNSVTTTVRKNAAEIEGYLRRIGAVEFATAMDEQMKTLGGAFKAALDTGIGVFASIGDAARIGAGALANAFDAAIDYVLELFADLGKAGRALFAGEFAEAAELTSGALSKSFETGFADARGRIEQALDENFGRDWLGEWMALLWREAGDIATPAIDDVAARAAERYRARLAATAKPTPATPAAGNGAVTGTGTTTAPAHDAKVLDDLRKRQLALLPVYDRLKAEADDWRKTALEGLDEQAAGYQAFRDQVEEIYGGMLAEARAADLRTSKRWRDGVIRGLAEVAREAGDAAAAMEDATTRAFGGMEDALVEFTRTGKLSFSSLVDSILVPRSCRHRPHDHPSVDHRAAGGRARGHSQGHLHPGPGRALRRREAGHRAADPGLLDAAAAAAAYPCQSWWRHRRRPGRRAPHRALRALRPRAPPASRRHRRRARA